ncbi:MAG: metallophosphoesterase family protein, partial [Thiohalospira sp.]
MPRILAIGDIHLGRRPSRLPADLDARELTPAAAWYAAVEAAVERGVDAVVLAGDVVEHPDDLYEAWTDLERGIHRLAGAGIPVVAVSGNHDTTVLPRLADALPDLRLLGREGRWEEMDLGGARLLGWSFPAPVHPHSPLADGLPPRTDATPRLGLLHC